MDANELNEFRVLLESRLAEVKTSHDVHEETLKALKDRSDHESGDLAQSLENKEVEEQIVLNDEYYMEKINKALLRIDAGTYGSCEGCCEDIPMARLRAKPSVSLCIECQEKRDAGA